MLSVETFLTVGIFLGKIAAITAIPVVYIWAGGSVYARLRARDSVAAIALAPLTHLAGLGVGLMLLWFSPHAEAYDVDRIFDRFGPWSIDFLTFLTYRANPWAYPWDALYLEVLSGPARGLSQIITLVFAVLGGVIPSRTTGDSWPDFTFPPLQAVILPMRRRIEALAVFQRPADLIRGSVICVGAMLWSAYLVVYIVNVLYWSLNSMNFWAFLLVAFIYQKYRYSRWRAS
ncbi:MAG: hypothetical protein O2995_15675 [Proteobacteria bacterium]|nr:hypothetical protein [Pseudomonadota bacterium]